MKNTFILFVLVFSSVLVRAQSPAFAPIGAQWWYGGDYFNYFYWQDGPIGSWVDHMIVTKDTSIQNVPCREIEYRRHSYNASGTPSVSAPNTIYVYDNIDTVFIFSEPLDSFVPLYIFNLAVDSIACLPVHYSTTNEIYCLELTSTQQQTYNGVPITIYDVYPFDTHFPAGSMYFIDDYSNLWGGSWRFLPGWYISDYSSTMAPCGRLRCYRDSTFDIHFGDSSIACDSVLEPRLLTIEEKALSQNSIRVYPNPASEQITIQLLTALKSECRIALHNHLGQQIFTKSMGKAGEKKLTIDLPNLPTGVYMLELVSDGNRWQERVLLMNK